MPNYCVMSDTVNIARQIEKHGEGMRILISETSKRLLDKVGGFRCESRGPLDIKVNIYNENISEYSKYRTGPGPHGDVLAGWTGQ